MKILIVQLARLGDIYQTWPAVKAYHKIHPQAEIHYLTRESFKDALVGLNEVKKVKVLSMVQTLEPLIARNNLAETISKNENFVNDLIEENYDEVFNLTYSAASASLCSLLEEFSNAKVYGYSRDENHYLKINDDIAEYFYAQVGIGRNNRIHLTDLFAWQMQVNLEDSDFDFTERNREDLNLPIRNISKASAKPIAIQVGASQKFKSMSSSHWIELIRQLSLKGYENFYLLGSPAEAEVADSICQAFPQGVVHNLVGKFKIYNHFEILSRCQMLIGADSAMIHMASLLNVPCVNVSIGAVNFWETGPRAKNSYIAKFLHADEIKIAEIIQLVDAVTLGNEPSNTIKTIEGCPSYFTQNTSKIEEFSWSFVRALYMEADYPIVDDLHSLKSFHSFFELNKMVLNEIEQYSKSKGESQSVHLDLLKSMESTLDLLAQKSRATMPLWNWIVGQRVRISHLSGDLYVEKLSSIHRIAESILKLYVMDDLIEESSMVK